MLPAPRSDLRPNTPEYERLPPVAPAQFCKYDARLFGSEINLLGVQALGLGLGTYLHECGVRPDIVTGHDFRSYSGALKNALNLGLLVTCHMEAILAIEQRVASPVGYRHPGCPANSLSVRIATGARRTRPIAYCGMSPNAA